MSISFDPAAYAQGTILVPSNAAVKGTSGAETPNALQPVVDTLASKSGKSVENSRDRESNEAMWARSQQGEKDDSQPSPWDVDPSVLIPLRATIQESENSEAMEYARRQKAAQAYRDNLKTD